MNKTRYYIIGIFIIFFLSIAYISLMNNDANGIIETGLNHRYDIIAENNRNNIDQTPTVNQEKHSFDVTDIVIIGKIFTGEEPITEKTDAYWYVNVIFDSNTTEKKAEEIISKYNIPKPNYIKRGFSYPEYYISANRGDFENIKKRLEEEYSQLQPSRKIKITGENITAAVWGVNDKILQRLRISGIQLRETMVMEIVYGPETPQIESQNIMRILYGDNEIIGTTVGIFY